jgi:chemotaxis methyl-accepting protein methylase
VRPALKEYKWEALDKVIRQWVTKNEQTWTIWSSVCSIRSW